MEKPVETVSANALQRTISVSSSNSSASEQTSSTPQKSQEPVNDEQIRSKSVPLKTRKKQNKSQETNVQSQSRHYTPRIQQSKTLIPGDVVIKGINKRHSKNNVL